MASELNMDRDRDRFRARIRLGLVRKLIGVIGISQCKCIHV